MVGKGLKTESFPTIDGTISLAKTLLNLKNFWVLSTCSKHHLAASHVLTNKCV